MQMGRNVRALVLFSLMFCVNVVRSHVPSYEAATCVQDKEVDADVSQVTYFEYAQHEQVVGMTLPLSQNADVWKEMAGGMQVSIGASRWIESTTSEFFIGCVSETVARDLCNQTEFPASVRPLLKYSGTHEPFTQSLHYAIEPHGDARIYRTGCNQSDVLALLVRPGMGGGRFSVTMGKSELFTLSQLARFPVFMSRNHGSFVNVNQVYWTICYMLAMLFALHAVLCLSTKGCCHYMTKMLGANTHWLHKAGSLACIASAMVYGSVIIDVMLQSVFVTQQDNVHKLNLGLFVGLVLVAGNLLPLFIVVYTWRVLTSGRDILNGIAVIGHAVTVAALILTCVSSLAMLGDWVEVLVLLTCIALCTMVGLFAVVRLPDVRTHIGAYAALFQIPMFVLLFFFLGSGYWFGPLLMVFASAVKWVHMFGPRAGALTQQPSSSASAGMSVI